MIGSSRRTVNPRISTPFSYNERIKAAIRDVPLLVVLLALGCSGGPSAIAETSSTGGASSEFHEGSAGSSFGGTPGADLPPLTAEDLDLPARLERGGCWEGALSETTCDEVPQLDPPLIEGELLRVPVGVCAQIVFRNPEALTCDPVVGCVNVPSWLSEKHEGPAEVATPSTAWRVWLTEGSCSGLGMGGGS